MKKLLALVLMLALAITLVSCDMLPDELAGKIEDIKNSILGGGEHVCEFVVTDSKEVGCEEDGYAKYACSCGETKEEIFPATGHDMVRTTGSKDPTCVEAGRLKTKCSVCGKTETQTVPATGHNLVSDEPSRGSYCTHAKCPYFIFNPGIDGKYNETFTFTFGDEDKAALEAKHQQMLDLFNSVEKYDPAKHAYAEEGALADAYAAAEAMYEEYNDLMWAARDQLGVARVLYYCQISNTELEATYNDMTTYYNALVSKFYELYQYWYDSMFREHAFYGMTEEEINAFLFDANAVANPEYTALRNANDELELALNALSTNERMSGDEVPKLYAEFAKNSNEMAKILGYENYLEYAYENVYSREYSYLDVQEYLGYVKTYLVPVYNRFATEFKNVSISDQNVYNDYLAAFQDSFFDSRRSNKIYNDYIDKTGIGFTSNPDKTYNFSDVLNNLASDGNLFRGEYEGAFVSYLGDAGIPFAYFGAGYNGLFTVAHEFGHYMNEIYNDSEYDQSYDLLEVHSQGHESLFLYYLETEKIFSGQAMDLINLQQMYSYFSSIISGLQVDAFEQAVYLDNYTGYGSEEIMADGTITYDEYDKLYAYIATDFGIDEGVQNNTYWRYGMTISSACYYVSYSVSAVNALQVYMSAYNDGFDAAKDGYLKLISYTDENPDMNMIEVFEYAGFQSYLDEDLYKDLAEFFKTH